MLDQLNQLRERGEKYFVNKYPEKKYRKPKEFKLRIERITSRKIEVTQKGKQSFKIKVKIKGWKPIIKDKVLDLFLRNDSDLDYLLERFCLTNEQILRISKL